MIGCLSPVFYLAQAFVDSGSCLADGFGKQLRIHKVGTGAGGQIAPVFYKLQASQIDFPIALDSVFNRASGFGKGRRI